MRTGGGSSRSETARRVGSSRRRYEQQLHDCYLRLLQRDLQFELVRRGEDDLGQFLVVPLSFHAVCETRDAEGDNHVSVGAGNRDADRLEAVQLLLVIERVSLAGNCTGVTPGARPSRSGTERRRPDVCLVRSGMLSI